MQWSRLSPTDRRDSQTRFHFISAALSRRGPPPPGAKERNLPVKLIPYDKLNLFPFVVVLASSRWLEWPPPPPPPSLIYANDPANGLGPGRRPAAANVGWQPAAALAQIVLVGPQRRPPVQLTARCQPAIRQTPDLAPKHFYRARNLVRRRTWRSSLFAARVATNKQRARANLICRWPETARV